MRPRLLAFSFALLACIATVKTEVASAESTIDPDAALAWGANVGWLNWRPTPTDGVSTGEYVCSGLIWAANAGWINLGSGVPANGIRYSNADGSDSGVNLMPDGKLRGLAWGANIGWINFEDTGNPRVDFSTGIISGHAWGANVGWITLDDGAGHFVAADSIAPAGDTDGDSIPDAWELEHVGDLATLTLDGDADGDGVSDAAEYAADTDPFNADQVVLRITDFHALPDGSLMLAWTSRNSRRYHIETADDLEDGVWSDSELGEIASDTGPVTMRVMPAPAAGQRFFRIRAKRPLSD